MPQSSIARGAQLDHVRQVQVEPAHPAVVEPLEARVQPGADLDYGAVGVPLQEVPDPHVEQGAAQHAARHPARLRDPLEVPVDRIHDLDRLGVHEERPPPAGL
jgi:hypothetical protein